MTYSVLTPEQIRRLRQYGAEAPGRFPVADHAPPRPASARLVGRQTYDAADLAEISNSLVELNRGVAEVGAAFQRRQQARATADAADRAAGRLTEAQRAEVAQHSRAVSDAAAAQRSPISRINERNAEFWRCPTPGAQPRTPQAPALPPGFTPDASGR